MTILDSVSLTQVLLNSADLAQAPIPPHPRHPIRIRRPREVKITQLVKVQTIAESNSLDSSSEIVVLNYAFKALLFLETLLR